MQKDTEQKQRMFALIEHWQSSGQSQVAYCKEASLAYHIFHYWYKVYREEKQSTKAAASAFVALQLKPAAAPCTPYAELILPNGKRLVFHQPVEVQILQLLLQ